MLSEISAGYWLEDIEDEQLYPANSDYVDWQCDDSPMGGLLWGEVRVIMRWAGRVQFVQGERQEALTEVQRKVLHFWMCGNSDQAVGRICGLSESTVRVHRERALEKVDAYPHKGLRTVMVEVLGWYSVREHLAGLCEGRTKR